MGAFNANRKDVITIHGPAWDEGEEVQARTIVRSGDEEWVLNQQMSIQPKSGNRKQRRASGFQKQSADGIDIKSQLGAVNRLWVQKMLESWTFTMNGLPMPFEKSGQNEMSDKRMGKIMQMLDQSYVDYIYEQIMEAQPKEAKAEEEDEEDDEENEEGSPFFANASASIAGEMFSPEQTNPVSMNGNPSTETPATRNFLLKS